MPDIAYQFDHATAEVKDCEYVSNPFRSNAGGDEDDFDEDSDEDEDSNGNDKSQKNLKLLQVSKLLCSFKKKVNEELEIHFKNTLISKSRDYPNLSFANSWYTLATNEKPNVLLC